MKIKKIDLIIVLICILFFGFLTILINHTGSKGSYVVISIDGVKDRIISLDDDGEYEICGYNNGKNILLIEDNEASMINATCPDGLCINQKPIGIDGETICCLPNRVYVEVVSDKHEDKEVDAVAR